jgi:CHC2 zinc finger.
VSYERDRLPDPRSYYENEGLRLMGPRSAKWKTAECRAHGGSDSMRVNSATGAFKCMACGVGGGDVLAYHMHMHDLEFQQAAKALGAWTDDGKVRHQQKPSALSPRAALEVLGFESTIVAVAASNLAKGCKLTEQDRRRVLVCAGRINRIVAEFAS